MNSPTFHLKCLICGREYAASDIDYVCPDHGWEGIVDVIYNYDELREQLTPASISACNDWSMGRYRPLLPLSPAAQLPPLPVGWTPLVPAARLAEQHQLKSLWIKDDGRQPTASLKDRASAVAVAKARAQGAPIVTTASTGNAAAALSGLSASVGQPNVIFVPQNAPPAKITQLLVYGSTVMLVEGTYDDAFELCQAAAEHFGWYNRNTGFNPYMSEGKKTVSYEIAEQLGWQAPDAVLVSVGDGCIIGGVFKGFYDLYQLGWISRIPRMIGVQAAGSNYMTEAWLKGEDVFTKPAISPKTVADSISAGLPRDRLKAMRAVQESHGAFLTVTDAEILQAIPELARGSGVFAEPAAATAYAGLEPALKLGYIQPDEQVVVISTGHGLKDIASARAGTERTTTRQFTIPPHLDAVAAILNKSN